MIRSFLPIGQGGFAVEQFKCIKKNIVFDCGTTTSIRKLGSKKTVEALIQKEFKPDEHIHMVFISHLHKDHINGLPFLLRYCIVDRIFLPYLTPEEQAITISLLHETMDNENLRFFCLLITGRRLQEFDINARITYILPPESKENNNEISQITQDTFISGKTINFESADFEPKLEWEFIPYCYAGNARSKQFMSLLAKQKITSDDIRSLLSGKTWEQHDLLSKIKKCYYEIVHDLNLTTMVVYSGAQKDYIYQRYWTRGNKRKTQSMDNDLLLKSGCLYTGDYRAANSDEWEDLKRAYDKVWDRIGIFTLPHHGSDKNYNEEFSTQNAIIIINAGYANRYGHPSRKVLCNLIENKCKFFWVNEHISSQAIFRIIPFFL